MAVQELTDSTYASFIANHRAALVEFWAEWCTYCKQMPPILNAVDQEFQGRLSVATVNVETETLISEQLEVKSLPTILLYVDGSPVGRVTGFVPKETLVNDVIQKLI